MRLPRPTAGLLGTSYFTRQRMTPLTKRGATVLLLVAIAIVLCAFLYSNTYDRSETERFGEVRLAPTIRRVQSQRYAENKTSRRLSGGADKPRNCVNYRPFINRLKFYPPVVVTKSMFSKVKRLVFFIGHQRSGSSLIGRLLDAHPHITIPHEVFSIINFYFFCFIICSNTGNKGIIWFANGLHAHTVGYVTMVT